MNSSSSSISTLLLALLFSFSLFSSSAFASHDECAQLFLSLNEQSQNQALWHKTKQYGGEVIESRGLRLFLKNSETNKCDEKWYGLLTKQRLDLNKTGLRKYLSAIASYLPRQIGRAFSKEDGYSFTPFNGLYQLTFKMPVEFVTSRYGNKRMEPAFFFKFPVIMVLSMSTYFGADAVYQERLQSHVNYEIAQHSSEYNKLIQDDYRYQKIKLSIVKGEMTVQDAQREAYLITLAYSQYFQFRDASDAEADLQSDMKLLNHYLFSHLKNVIMSGVQKADLKDGYYVPETALGKLSDAQILELFNNTHQRYLKYQIISEMVGETALWRQIKINPKMQTIVDSIVNDPFTIQLYELRGSGRITTGQLQSYLQEDAYWQNRFQDWKTIGVTRLKRVDGKYNTQALTLADIRQEVLVEIAKR